MATSKKDTTSTDVAVVNQNALVAAPDFMNEDFNGNGFEGADKDSFAIPFIQVLQKMSPLVDEDDPKHVEGAKAGMLYNTVTQQLFDGKEGITIIPCAYKRSYIQWAGKDAEGGFKGEFTPEQITEMQNRGEIVVQEGKLLKPLPDGTLNEKKCDLFSDTRSHFVLVINEQTGEVGQAILSLSSSQIKSSKMLMTSLQQKKVDSPKGRMTPPTFANKVKLTTIGMSNDKGSWSGVRFELDGLVTDPVIYADAKAFYKAIVAGEVKVDHAKSGQDVASGGVDGTPQEADNF